MNVTELTIDQLKEALANPSNETIELEIHRELAKRGPSINDGSMNSTELIAAGLKERR